MCRTEKHKIEPFLDRGEIRDCFDIEFLLRRGTDLPVEFSGKCIEVQKKIARFRDVDFNVKLGSILEKDVRDYYVENRFSFLEEKLAAMISHTQTPLRKP